MKTTITLALVLGGCNYDYAIMESPDEPSSETIIVYEPTNIPSGNSQVQEEVTDTGSDVVDTVIVDAADTDTGTPPAGDTDESTAETEEDTGTFDDTSGSFEDPPTVDSDPPVDDGVDVDTDAEAPPVIDSDPPVEPELPPVDTDAPPPVPEEPDWSLLYYEDFSDGLAQDWSKFNGGCGSQGVTGDPPVWSMASDWNGARVPVPVGLGARTRLTVEAEITRPTVSAVVRWMSNPVAWNTNDDGGISFYYVGASGAGAYVGGHLVAPYPMLPEVATTLQIETLMDEYSVSVDGMEIAAGSLAGVETLGDELEVHGNGPCGRGTLVVRSVKIESTSF